MRPIEKLVIHCSDSPDSRDIGAAEIREWHVNERGFYDIGYHRVIRRNGVAEMGRADARIGAHCRGHNLYSIGICLVGRTAFTSEQMATLVTMCRDYMATYGLKPDQVFGHYELDQHGKTCPNFDVSVLRHELGA